MLPKTQRLVLIALILGGPCLPVPSAAQGEPMAEEPAFTQEEEVTVEGSAPYFPRVGETALKMPLALERTPASVTALSRELLEEQGARVLGDALHNAPGVDVQANFGVHDYFTLRGFDSLSSALVLTDGVPEPEASFYQLYNVERVEVLRGPAGFAYGGNPLAGAVNLARKRPGGERSLRLGAAFGSWATSEGTLDYDGGTAAVGLRLNALWRDSEGFRDGREVEARAINPVLSWRAGEGRFTLSLEAARIEAAPDAGLPLLAGAGGSSLPAVPRERSYQSPFDFSEQDVGRAQLDFEIPLGRAVLRNKTYFRGLDWRSDGTLFNGVFPGSADGLAVSRTLTRLDDDQELVGNQLELLHTLQGGAARHELVVGLEVSRLRDEFTLDALLLPEIDLFAPLETATDPAALFPLPGQSQAADAESRVVAPYVIDRVVFSERWQVILGARLDRLEYEDAVAGLDRGESRVSPLLGVVFAPRDGLSFYAQAAAGFAPPSTRVAASQREPEESEQVEVGVKARLGEGARLALALYRLEKSDIPIVDGNGFTAQAGDQRSRGLELELTAALAADLDAHLAYAYNDAELTRFTELALVSPIPPTFGVVDRSGSDAPFAPRHILDLWLAKRFAGGFEAALGARWVDRQFIAPDNAFALDDALTLDASVAWRRGGWRWRLHLKNLTDEEYETRGFGTTSVIPAPGFSLLGGLEYRL